MNCCFLVTGGNGFIGSAVVEEMVHRGIECHVVTRNPVQQRWRAGVVYHQLNLLTESLQVLAPAIRPTHFLHLAWEATPGRYRNAPENYDWASASLRLAEAFFQNGGRHFTLAGSCAEYAPSASLCNEATTPPFGDCAYTICKLETARRIAVLANERGGTFSTGRFFYVYGPGEPERKLIRTICEGLVRGAAVPLTSGTDCLDFIHVTDAARALVALALSGLRGPMNIGIGRGIFVRDLAAHLGKIAGRPELLQLGKIPLGREPLRIVADTHRLNSELGFRPAMDLERGLRMCLEHWAALKSQALEAI